MGAKSNIYPNTHADTYELDLEVNDILIMGSDGLFDNLFVEEIVSLIDVVSLLLVILTYSQGMHLYKNGKSHFKTGEEEVFEQ